MTEGKVKARARSLAFRYLAQRPRSRAEMALFLKKKEVPEDAARETMADLEGYGYIDDRRFAADYGRYLLKRKCLSRFAVKSELARKGVDEADIAPALDALFGEDGEDEESIALRAATKKSASLKGLDKEKARRRLADHLRRRGFSFGIVLKTLKKFY